MSSIQDRLNAMKQGTKTASAQNTGGTARRIEQGSIEDRLAKAREDSKNSNGWGGTTATPAAEKFQRETEQWVSDGGGRRSTAVVEAPSSPADDHTVFERMWDILSGAGKGTASDFTNLGGTVTEGLGRIGSALQDKKEAKLVAQDQAYLEQARRDLAAAQAAGDEKAAKIAQININQAEYRLKNAGVLNDLYDEVNREATKKIYSKADQLSASAQQDIDEAKEGLGGVGQFLVDTGVAGAQLAGDMGLAMLTGGSSTLPMAARVFGGSAGEARQNGADFGEQLAYGAGSALVSGLTEKLGNVGGVFKSAFGSGVLDKALAKVATKPMGKLVASALSEGAEEMLEAVAQPMLQRLTYDPDAAYDEDWLAEMLYSGAIGAVLGGAGAAISPSTYISSEADAAVGQSAPAELAQAARETTSEGNSMGRAENAAEGLKMASEGIGAERTLPSPAERTRVSALDMARETLGESGYKAFEAAYRDGDDPSSTYGELTRAYNDGLAGSKTGSRTVTEAQYNAMYEAGRADVAASIEAQAKQAGYTTVYGKDSGLVYDEYVKTNVDAKTAKTVNTVAKALGIRVQFADSVAGGSANADILNGVVTIEKGNANPVRFLFGHEITHRMQEMAPAEYARLREAVASGGWADAAVKRTQDLYARHGKTIDSEAALDEAVADYVGALLEDSGELERFIRKHQDDRTLLQKLRDAFRELGRKLRGSQYDKQIRNVEKRLSETLDAAVKQVQANEKAQKNTTQTGGVKYNLKPVADIESQLGKIRDLDVDFNLNAISVGTIPDIFTQLFDISELDLTVNMRHAYNSMVTAKQAKKDGMLRKGFRDDYHGMGVAGYASAIKSVATPLAIMDADKSGQLNNLRVSMILRADGIEEPLFGVIEFYSNASIEGRTPQRAHALLSIYDKDTAPEYAKTAAKTDRVLYIDKEQDLGGTPALQLRSGISDSALKKNLARFNKKVNTFKIDNKIDDAALLEKRVETGNYDVDTRVDEGKPIAAGEEALYSLKHDRKFMENAMQANAKYNRVSPAVMKRASEARQAVADIFNDPELAESLGLPPDIIGNTYIPNGSYSGTEENTTVCIRSIAADALMDAVAEKLGRPLTVEDTIAISQEYWKYTDRPECLYCYVAMDRKAHREFMGSYLQQRDMVLDSIRKGMDRDEVYQKFLDGRKDTKPMQNRFNMWLKNADREMIKPADLASYANMEKALERNPALKEQINDALKYAQSASWAKKRVAYAAYNGHILKWKKSRIDSLNSNYGLRMYSFSDFSPAFILENMQMITDAAVRNLKVLAYTKELDFVRIFAKTGMNINISVFGYDDGNGGVAMDAMQGADWSEAQSLREQYQNVGCTFVATNDAQVNWALEQDWIDVIIPFHMVRTGTKVAEHFGWKNYTSMSADTKTRAFDSAKNLAHILPPVHQNDKSKYLQACRENNLTPRFNDWVDHPNYMKLVNETRRSEMKSKPVQPIFDVDAAKASIEDMRKRGGYYTPIGGSQENMLDIAEEIADSINSKAKFSLKDSDSLAREIARIQKEGRAKKRSDADIQADISAVVQQAYQGMISEYGVIAPGENPARNVQVPKRTSDDKKVSQTVRTVLEAQATPDEALPNIEQMIATGDFSYDVYTDEAAIADAENKIRHGGWAQALADWTDSMRRGEVSKANTAMGWALYNNAANSGDMKTALTVLEHMIQHQRNAAQALQATRILKKMSPETQLYQIQRSVESLQEELNERYGDKKAPKLEISPELAERYRNAKTQEERDEVMKDIYRDIGRQLPSRFIDKWNAWRYLAMLGNPRTHVRNIVGNAGFAPVVAAKNLTATAIESVVGRVSGGRLNRTKSLVGFSKGDRALLKAAWADFDKVQDAAMGGGKYSEFANANKYIEEGRQIFKFKPLEAARKGNTNAMEAEDMWFSRPHYAAALASYCKQHGLTAEQIQRGKETKNARAYAMKEAQKATYRDTNALSQTISELGKPRAGETNPVKKGVGVVMEGILPFRKTPANILARGLEYSPVGLLNGIKQAVFDVKRGKKTGAEAIDSISAGLTGTGLLALGMYLAAEGLVRGHGDDDEEENEFLEMAGHQAYALEIGDESYTLDWLAPEALPFFVGVNLWEQTSGEDEELTLSAMLNAAKTVTEPLLEMSCLQSLNDVFDSVGYATSDGLDGLPAALASAATSYLTQGLPTLLGQAERTGEDVRMTTYTEKNDFLTGDLQYILGKASARIPGWEYQQIPYIDAWGRTESSGATSERAANNFLNPAYTSEIQMSAMEEELLRLYEETGEGTVLPSRAEKYFEVNKKRKDLTADEYVKFAQKKGQTAYAVLTGLTQSSAYKAMSNANKVKAISQVYSYAGAVAKMSVSNYKPDGWIADAVAASKSTGLSADKYLTVYLSAQGIESLKNKETGETIKNSQSLLVMQMIYNTRGLNDAQRKALIENLTTSTSVRHYDPAKVKEELAKMRKQAK